MMDENFNQSPFFFSTASLSEENFSVRSFTALDDAICSHYHFWIEVIVQQIVKLSYLVGKIGHLKWDNNWRHGMVACVHDRGKQKDGYCYIIELASPLHPLLLNQQSRIFVNKKLSEILTTIYHPLIFKLENDILISYLVQHKEIDYEFFKRVLKQYQCSWVYQHDENKTSILIFDNLNNIVGNIIDIESLTQSPVIVKNDLFNKIILVETDSSLLSSGNIVRFKDKHYRVLSIRHHKNYRERYIARLKLIAPQLAYYTKNPHDIIKHRTPHLTATIESLGGDYPYLQQDGCYFSRLYFDHSDIPPTQASQPQYLIESHDGMHLPLMSGTQMVVSHIEGDVSQPILVGVISDALPVTAENNSQHIYQTKGGNQLLIEDKNNYHHIQLHNPAQQNILLLDATTEKVEAHLQSREKMIRVEAKRNSQTISKDSHYQQSRNHRLSTKNNQMLNAQKIEVQSGKNFVITAKNKLTLKSQAIQLTSQKQTTMSTKNNMGIESQSGNVILKTTKNNFLIHAQKDITLIAKNKFNLHGGECGISMNGNQLIFDAQQLKVNAQSISCPQPMSSPVTASSSSVEDRIETTPIELSSVTPKPVLMVKLNNKNNDEEFKLFVATVYGESANSSPAAWKAVASTILNRLNNKRFAYGPRHHRKIPKTIKEVVQTGGYQAYLSNSPQYTLAKNYLNNRDLKEPEKLEDIIKVIKPIYDTKRSTTNAVLYYSPNTEKKLYGIVKPYDWNFSELQEVYPNGLLVSDDFRFFIYK